MSLKDTGERLKAVRKETLGISSGYTMAQEMGVSQSTYAQYETGKMEMGVNFLTKLYEKYGILPTYIVSGTGPIKAGPESKKELVTDISHLKAKMEAIAAKVDYLSRNLHKK